MDALDVKKLFLLLAVASLFSGGLVSTMPVFADDDDRKKDKDDKKDKKEKTLESECAKKRLNNFDGLFCVAILELQTSFDSFFDIFTELQADVEELKGGTEDINIGIGELQEDVGEIQTEIVALDLRGQNCPLGEVMVGITSDGLIVCEPFGIPSCSDNGTFEPNFGICICDPGFEGEDCSVVTPPPSAQCTAQEVDALQLCTASCGADINCIQSCSQQASQQCNTAVLQLSLCALGSGCVDPTDPNSVYSQCTFQSCSAEWEGVFGDSGFSCPVGTTSCGGNCVDIGSDINNCGACNNACPSFPNTVPMCSNAACSSACEAGFADLDGIPFNGCEEPVPPTDLCSGIPTVRSCGASDIGQCSFGVQTRTCDPATGQVSAWGICTGSVDPSPEVCDGLDNNCDGTTDEGGVCTSPISPTLVINEIDYDQPGPDTAEFVEIYNYGSAPVSLGDVILELINGSTGGAYTTISLATAGALNPGEYLVVGSASVLSAVPTGTPTIPNPDNFIQNGAPDCVRLTSTFDLSLIDSVSYEGLTLGCGEGSSAPTDESFLPGSIGRDVFSSDTDDNSSDFAFSSIPTPGLVNSP